jgi:hypothetical protein
MVNKDGLILIPGMMGTTSAVTPIFPAHWTQEQPNSQESQENAIP